MIVIGEALSEAMLEGPASGGTLLAVCLCCTTVGGTPLVLLCSDAAISAACCDCSLQKSESPETSAAALMVDGWMGRDGEERR